MNKAHLKFYLLLCITSICLHGLSTAQDISTLYALYEAREMEQLEQRLATLPESAGQVSDVIFFRTVFNENGEEALTVYEDLFQQADGWLRHVTAVKLAQYYYARGYYVKAAGYAEIAEVKPSRPPQGKISSVTVKTPVPPSSPGEALYAIQVGAFSYRDNAQKMLNLLNRQHVEAKIVDRQINGKPLFCVWINGKNDPDETRDYAQELKKKYNIPYRIVKTQ